jgi:hypothetical protein
MLGRIYNCAAKVSYNVLGYLYVRTMSDRSDHGLALGTEKTALEQGRSEYSPMSSVLLEIFAFYCIKFQDGL